MQVTIPLINKTSSKKRPSSNRSTDVRYLQQESRETEESNHTSPGDLVGRTLERSRGARRRNHRTDSSRTDRRRSRGRSLGGSRCGRDGRGVRHDSAGSGRRDRQSDGVAGCGSGDGGGGGGLGDDDGGAGGGAGDGDGGGGTDGHGVSAGCGADGRDGGDDGGGAGEAGGGVDDTGGHDGALDGLARAAFGYGEGFFLEGGVSEGILRGGIRLEKSYDVPQSQCKPCCRMWSWSRLGSRPWWR